jgi:ATP-binding cassette, subfamily B, bacterial MsbA
VNLLSSVLEALSEGATLAVVFLAVEVLAAPDGTPLNGSTNPVLSWWPAPTSWLNALPPTALFISLLALAVLLQALQSLGRFANNVSVGSFAAECRARVTARIHSQVLRFSFPCASGTKVGDLTDDASQGPEAIRIQIEQSGQLLAVELVGAAWSDWDEPGLASP